MNMRVGLYPLTSEPGCWSGGTGTGWKSGNSGSRLQAVYLPKYAISVVQRTWLGLTSTRCVPWSDPRTLWLTPRIWVDPHGSSGLFLPSGESRHIAQKARHPHTAPASFCYIQT